MQSTRNRKLKFIAVVPHGHHQDFLKTSNSRDKNGNFYVQKHS